MDDGTQSQPENAAPQKPVTPSQTPTTSVDVMQGKVLRALCPEIYDGILLVQKRFNDRDRLLAHMGQNGVVDQAVGMMAVAASRAMLEKEMAEVFGISVDALADAQDELAEEIEEMLGVEEDDEEEDVEGDEGEAEEDDEDETDEPPAPPPTKGRAFLEGSPFLKPGTGKTPAK